MSKGPCNLVKVDGDGNVMCNYEGMLRFLCRSDLNFIPPSNRSLNAVAYFGKRDAILGKPEVKSMDMNRLKENGIYCYTMCSSNPIFVVLNDIYFNVDPVPDVTMQLLRIMMLFCSTIEFVLSETDVKIMKKINELYSVNCVQTSSGAELLNMSWLFLIRQISAECATKPNTTFFCERTEFYKYLEHLGVAESILFTSNSILTTSTSFPFSPQETINRIIRGIPLSWDNLGSFISRFSKRCFVVCLIGCTLSIPENLLKFSTKDEKRHLVCEEDFEIIILDLTGLDELKALVLAAHVANYTICNTKPSTLQPLLQKIPKSTNKRTNSAPLCILSKDAKFKDQNSLASPYFGGRIDTASCGTEEDQKNHPIWKRIILEFQVKIGHAYPNGKSALERVNEAFKL